MPGCKIVFVVLLLAFLSASSVQGMQISASAGPGQSEAVTVRFEEPSDEALSRVERVRATRMGVDRSGNLWAWSRASRRLQVLSPAGGLVYGETLEPAVAVDFDAEYGVAVLALPPNHAYIAGSDGSMRHRIETPPDATDIVWLDADRVAIALAESDHSVEVWDLARASKVAEWGSEKALPTTPGAYLRRSFLLDYDHEAQRLYAFDTGLGTISILDSAGGITKVSVGSDLPSSDREWLADLDEQKRQENERHPIGLLRWLDFSVDREGGIWLVERCAEERLTLLRLSADGDARRTTVEDITCCSKAAVLWGSAVIVYRPPGFPDKLCNNARRISK